MLTAVELVDLGDFILKHLALFLSRKPPLSSKGSSKDLLQSPTGKDERNRIRRTFWSYLFRNVNR
jgi:hypothetical protein